MNNGCIKFIGLLINSEGARAVLLVGEIKNMCCGKDL